VSNKNIIAYTSCLVFQLLQFIIFIWTVFFSVAIFAFIAYKKQSTCIPLCRSVREPDMNVICSWIHIYP